MSREKEKLFVTWFKYVIVVFAIFYPPYISCSKTESFLHYINPSIVKQYPPTRPRHQIEYFKGEYIKGRESEIHKRFQGDKVFQIEPSDAIDVAKYSQPALSHQDNHSLTVKVPSMTVSTVKLPLPTQYSDIPNLPEQTVPSKIVPNNASKSIRDSRYIESSLDKNSNLPKSSLENDYKLQNEGMADIQSDMGFDEESSLKTSQSKNNFSDIDSHMLPVPSDAILSYQTPSVDIESDSISEIDALHETKEKVINISSQYSGKPILTFSNSVILNTDSPEYRTEQTNTYNNYHHVGVLNLTESIEDVLSTSTIPSMYDEGNFSSNVPFYKNESGKLSSGTVAGIVIAVLVCVTLLSSSVIYLLYKKYNGKCTSVVESKFNTDNCGYLDDSLRSSIYLNNHIELPKESSEEMSSLDNDSFLNSLETMTIQNYWADNSKNTKV
ncbi:uncharacterized protein [Parasteatoda tepidariorum]|uniref:uncharacterized protein n=1 Tax=Parasteatoda tepidariorum TaxID=114398 RepID=UPI00077FA384|nr:uncharacterized protein LOC107439177 [Parasteatoda tepidariorum]XP_015907152.1 uncharacterized protein LOC107439177 [Parasteatoda tepidariorum]XP_015907153.1 uncharacterized protein LOC107439177 [Parasteatoda tepidariorum]XP_015907155.1 uncharacterized protein LOC107439177 [Parasteatoda tepidariorum]